MSAPWFSQENQSGTSIHGVQPSGDVRRGVDIPADAVQSTVGLLPGMIDHQQNQVMLGDRNSAP